MSQVILLLESLMIGKSGRVWEPYSAGNTPTHQQNIGSIGLQMTLFKVPHNDRSLNRIGHI